MTLRQHVVQEISQLAEDDLRELARFISDLRARSVSQDAPHPDCAPEQDWARLYADCADEDRAMADTGLADTVRHLAEEDAA
jgi:hypothetical protein